MASTIQYIEDGGRKIFRVTVNPATSGVMFIAEVDEISAWGEDEASTPAEFERYLHCTIKWDSCSTFNFESGLHLCGAQDYRNHARLMRELYTMAFKYMGREPQADEVWL